MAQFVITDETVTLLTREREQLQREIAERQDRLRIVEKKLEAIPLFLPTSANGLTHEIRLAENLRLDDKAEPEPEAFSLPNAVLAVLKTAGRSLGTLEIREALLARGVPRERLGATYSYMYTVLGRLEGRNLVQRHRGRYRLIEAAA